MNKFFVFMFFCLLFFSLLISCSDDIHTEIDYDGEKQCASNSDCHPGMTCDTKTGKCVEPQSEDNTLPVEDNDNNNSDDVDSDNENDENDDDNNNDNNTDDKKCNPGDVEKCPYSGPPETEDVGECRAGERTCRDDGTWGFCEGEVLPVPEIGELCHNGKDDDCTGLVDTGIDWDGDGVPACFDCCSFEHECPDPANAWDPEIHVCSWEDAVEPEYICDEGLSTGNNKNAMDYAKAIGLCEGVTSAQSLLPDGKTGAHNDSHGLLTGFGSVIKPTSGDYFLMLSSGKVANSVSEKHFNHGSLIIPKRSDPPLDWYEANGNNYPVAPACGTSATNPGRPYDPVMLQLEIQVPVFAKSFSVDIYFFSVEYPAFVCSTYNDFFVALLDSTYNAVNPDSDLKNPEDKNLAMDSAGNPVGVNLAPAGLFTQCDNISGDGWEVTSCEGKEELAGTGLTIHGGTGWLTTRGNVVGGETIKLRFAIWDAGDAAYDSYVIIDNFRWEMDEVTPGTGSK